MVKYSSILSGVPTLKKTCLHKIEMVKRRAPRFVLNNHNLTDSITSMLQSLKWPTLEARRFLKLILMFKILNNQIYILFSHTRGYQHHQLCIHLQYNCEACKSSFIPSMIQMWNSLPSEIAMCVQL